MVDNIHLALIEADSHNGVEGVVKNGKISFSLTVEQWRRNLRNIGEAQEGYIFLVDFYRRFARFEEVIPISKSQILGRLEPHGPHC